MKQRTHPASINDSDSRRLVEYVRNAASQGHSTAQIRSDLLHAGWHTAIIDGLMSPGQHASAVIKCENISKRFGPKTVLENISLDIEQGEVFGIIGLSGSGKTTLLNSIIGFMQPDAGKIFFRNPATKAYMPMLENHNAVKRLFGFATQDPSFYAKLTTEENLDHFGSLYNLDRDIRKSNVRVLLELMGLKESKDTYAENLSGGMQRRLGIACSLIHDPEILILDEPTADLDPLLRREMGQLIRKINKQGTTVILSSHFLDEIDDLCTKIAVLHNKNVLAIGTPDELRKMVSKDEEIHVKVSSGNYEKIRQQLQRYRLGISKLEKKQDRLIIYTPKAESILHHILHIIERSREKLVEVDLRKPSLREVFEHLIEK
jgi:ABC-2 type transport system ATP-binding protein